MDINKLLYLLSDGEFHSGSQLGAALGLSRTSIWKALPLLQKLTVVVEAVKGKGYRIPNGLDLLDKNIITSLLLPYINSFLKIEILLSHSSTNDYLVERLKGCNISGYQVCLAEMQTSGRGRRGRVWVSPFAKNIYLSLAFSLGAGAEQLSGLSLVVGIAVAKALENLGVKGVGLKWPNDVFVGDKKIAGILLDLSGEATTSWNVICGIGLNVAMSKKDGSAIDQEWSALNEYIECNRNAITVELLKQLVEVIEEFKYSSFSEFMGRWNSYDVLHGKEVVILPGNRAGRCLGVNALGALIVNDGQDHVVSAGEVSVRKL